MIRCARISLAKGMLFSYAILAIMTLPVTAQTINIIGEDSSNLSAIEIRAREYTSKTGVSIQVKKLPFDDALQTANQDLAFGTGKFDIILQYNFTLANYVGSGNVWKLRDLKARYPNVSTNFESSLFKEAWLEIGYFYESGSQGRPEAFGYPFAANTLLLVYNRSMFESETNKKSYETKYHRPLRPPQTWAEFRDIAEFFTKPPSEEYGVVLQGAAGGWLYYEFAAILASEGIQVLPKSYGWESVVDSKVDLSNARILNAAEEYIALKPYNAGDFKKTDAVIQREIMKRGKTAMAIMWSDYLPDLAGIGGSHSSQFGFTTIPGEASPLAGGSFYINKKSRQAKAAFEFVSWLLQEENQERMMLQGLASPLKSAYSETVLKAVPYAAALKASLERGVYAFEANRDSELIQNALTEALQRAFDDPAHLSEYFSQASVKINKERPTLLMAK
jgi:multiple sugar transport system substrate-binding protein